MKYPRYSFFEKFILTLVSLSAFFLALSLIGVRVKGEWFTVELLAVIAASFSAWAAWESYKNSEKQFGFFKEKESREVDQIKEQDLVKLIIACRQHLGNLGGGDSTKWWARYLSGN